MLTTSATVLAGLLGAQPDGLLCGWGRSQHRPQAFLGPLAGAGDQAFQHGHAGQHHLFVDQSLGGQVEQQGRALGADPRPLVHPAGQ
ncbi:hypothetical protein OG936_39920 (plasmid) [Streptomyces sp. NBC_00846]|uniref:hypothetical protein n=1 Tax=Streptomyces sp. NBC_00846 TaxID=2975849 RepID=UPI002F9127F6|nr:hypothetical protein OG936_39920 [Streptomyces sp. NBC_00846]